MLGGRAEEGNILGSSPRAAGPPKNLCHTTSLGTVRTEREKCAEFSKTPERAADRLVAVARRPVGLRERPPQFADLVALPDATPVGADVIALSDVIAWAVERAVPPSAPIARLLDLEARTGNARQGLHRRRPGRGRRGNAKGEGSRAFSSTYADPPSARQMWGQAGPHTSKEPDHKNLNGS
jgi:hypothetical protein